ncbi:MAG: lysylphosphatidylglycerol synthase transmembrane domain-containing protein [Planctomycetota bacterium]
MVDPVPNPLGARRRWLPWLRACVAVALLAALFTTVPWRDRAVLDADGATHLEPGLASSLRALEPGAFALACLLALGGTVTASLRWTILLRALGLAVSPWRALRLNLAGLAASQVLLGSVGGDVVKGALVTRDVGVPRDLDSRAGAVLAIVADRVVGLAALLTLGTGAMLAVGGELGRFARFFGAGLAALLGAVLIALVVAARMERSGGGTGAFARLLGALHETLRAYAAKPGALFAASLLSFASHSFLIVGVAALGRSLGLGVDTLRFFLTIPVVETAQAVPVSPAGWGVAEGMYVMLLGEQGVTQAMALSLAIAVRGVTLSQALLGVPGLLALLRPRAA